MPCDTKRITVEFTAEDRKREILKAIDALERGLSAGTITAVVGPQGAVAFKGWREGARDMVSDTCAYRKLTARNSAALRRALMRAEALAGRAVSRQAIGAGYHSHDGGTVWGRD